MAKKQDNLATEQIATPAPVEEVAVAMSATPVALEAAPTEFDVEKTRKKERVARIFKSILVYVFLTLCALLAFLPFYWMVISSVKTEEEYRLAIPTFFPQQFQFRNYSVVLSSTDNNGDGSFVQILINTLLVGLVSTTLGVIVTILTAYALARMNFKGKNILFAVMLATMMIPGEMFTISNYLTISEFGWRNSYTVLILPFLVSVYYIYLLRNNFMQIPNSLYQAAKVDGLSDMGYLIKVMVPLTAPTLVSVTLLKFIGTWNSYIWPRLVNTNNWQMITNWVTGGFIDKANAAGEYMYPKLDGVGSIYGYDPLTTYKMAAVCMVSLPLFVLFIVARKYIMQGVSKSGTKG